MLLRQPLPLLETNLPPRRALISLTPHQVHHRPLNGVILRLLEPPPHRGKGVSVRDVVDEDYPVGTAVVAVGEGAEAFLAGGVEEV